MMNRNIKYLYIIETTKNGFSAYVPDLPGCITVGDSLEETKKNIKEAIELYLEELKLDNQAFPHSNIVNADIINVKV